MVSVRCTVRGRVQGVWFRGGTAEQAQRLGVTGFARNCADGSVEVVAHGPEDAVASLVEWLWQGTPMAEVTGVEVERLEPDPAEIPAQFSTA